MATIGPDDRERITRDEPPPPDVGPFSGRHATERARRGEGIVAVMAGGSVTEAVGGGGAVVLAILGLAGTWPGLMAAIATIACGTAILAQGSSLAARNRQVFDELGTPELAGRPEIGPSIGTELLGGAAGIVLGILSLTSLGTAALVPIAVVVMGGALLLGGAAPIDPGYAGRSNMNPAVVAAARQAHYAASGTQTLVGIGAVVLGILALAGIEPIVSTLVALLVLGASVLLVGASGATRAFGTIRR